MHRAPPPYSIQLSRLTDVRVSLYSPDTSKLPHKVQRGSRREGTLPALSQHLEGSICNKGKMTEKGHASRREGLALPTGPKSAQ